MCKHACLPAYYKYLTKKFDWPNHTTDQIKWHTIKLTMNCFTILDRIQIQKIIHKWIPTRVSPGNNPSAEINQLCPSCQRHHKTPEHLLQCDTPAHKLLLTHLRTKLITIFTKHQIDPHIYQMWWFGLTTLNNPADHHIGLYLPSFHPIYWSQATIGWKQLYYQRSSKQSTHYLMMNHPEIDAMKYFALIIQTIWTYILEVWQQCNADQTIATAKLPPNMWS